MENDEIKLIHEDSFEITERAIALAMGVAKRLGLKYKDPQTLNLIMSWGHLTDKAIVEYQYQLSQQDEGSGCGSDCGCGTFTFSVKE